MRDVVEAVAEGFRADLDRLEKDLVVVGRGHLLNLVSVTCSALSGALRSSHDASCR